MNGEGDFRETPVSNVNESEEPSTSQVQPRNRRLRRGRRGSRMRDLALSRSAGEKIDIQFDEHLNPVGPNKSKFNSYLGSLARSKPSILTNCWRNVEQKTKDLMWDSIRLTYNVPHSEMLKKKTLSYLADRWRKFKTTLSNKYIFEEVPAGQPPPSPCEKYAFIDEPTWQEFVRMRTTPEALRKREVAQVTGRMNDCPQRWSRGGYEMAAKEFMKAKRKRLEEEAESNPSVLENPPSPIKREELWLYLRQKPSGAYTSEKTREVAEKIDQLKKLEAEGSFVSDGRNDILASAIGKPDHAGRVKGVGGKVGLKQYFGSSKRLKQDKVTREEMQQVVLQATQEAYEKGAAQTLERAAVREAELTASLTAKFHSEISKLKDEFRVMFSSSSYNDTTVPVPHVQQSTRGSCIVGQTEGPQHCDLYVEDPEWQLVAQGTVHDAMGSTVHHKQMDDDQVRVSVEKVFIADAPVPLPTDKFKVVGHVVGSFIAWPKKLVDCSPPPPKSADKPPAKEELRNMVFQGSLGSPTWDVKDIVGVPHMLPVIADQQDVLSLLLPKAELTVGIFHIFFK